MHALARLPLPDALRVVPTRWRPAVVVLAAALALHAWVLWPAARQAQPGPQAAPALALVDLRTLPAALQPAAPTASLTAAAGPAPGLTSTKPSSGAARVAALPRALGPAATTTGASASATAAPSATASPAAGATAHSPAAASDEEDAGAQAPSELAALPAGGLPRDATRLPGPAQLSYRLSRSAGAGQPAREGRAELRWQPQADGSYRLELLRQWQGGVAMGWASRGQHGAQGLAPERFADLRRQREVAAANFERESGRIRFSGPQIEYPLWPGVQDRATWLLHLAAVLQADATKRESGAQIAMVVVGARGDASVWRFSVVGTHQAGPTGDGSGPIGLHLQRRARHAYDTQVDVWLDPQREHLPLAVRWLALPSGLVTEMRLE